MGEAGLVISVILCTVRATPGAHRGLYPGTEWVKQNRGVDAQDVGASLISFTSFLRRDKRIPGIVHGCHVPDHADAMARRSMCFVGIGLSLWPSMML